MIVLSINTKTKKVDLISLPRDTYANIPGVEGIYKLNASIDCGGGWPTAEGFEKVCEAAVKEEAKEQDKREQSEQDDRATRVGRNSGTTNA